MLFTDKYVDSMGLKKKIKSSKILRNSEKVSTCLVRTFFHCAVTTCLSELVIKEMETIYEFLLYLISSPKSYSRLEANR